MNTFERYLPKLDGFVDRVLEFKPTHIVPVAKKGAKLLRLSPRVPGALIRYREFFLFSDIDLRGARVAVVDDATQHTSGLKEHREFFKRLGVEDEDIGTFSFVGHAQLFEGRRWKYDARAHIEVYLPDPVYQEYILQQSRHLLATGNHFDIDHLVYELPFKEAELATLLQQLQGIGLVLASDNSHLDANVLRFALDATRFFDSVPFLQLPSVKAGTLRKLKFAYRRNAQTLAFAPLVFPTWIFKDQPLPAGVFAEVPFHLPLDPQYRPKPPQNRSLFRTYFNICATYQVALLKATMQRADQLASRLHEAHFRGSDLAALVGHVGADRFLASAKHFLSSETAINFAQQARPAYHRVLQKRHRLRDFAEVVDALRDGYARAVRARRRRIGVHYHLDADTLFSRYVDATDLSAKLDHFCDLGVIVAGNIERAGTICRGYRSGEPNADYSWKRTQLIIPVAIDAFAAGSGRAGKRPGPTVLNKLIANLQFDYPRRAYPELHCFIGEPYRFGTLVRVSHDLRAPTRPTLYETKKISPYYRYSEDDKQFSVRNFPQVLKQLRVYFDDRQEVPYSELVAYIRFLVQAYRSRQHVDILNALSICREENYFYSHIVHNVRASASILALCGDMRRAYVLSRVDSAAVGPVPRTRQYIADLKEARNEAESASEKLRLAGEFPNMLDSVVGPLGKKPEFVKIVERIEGNYTPFTARLTQELPLIAEIVSLESALANSWLAAETQEVKYTRAMLSPSVYEALANSGISAPTSALDSFAPGTQDLIDRLLGVIDAKLRLLPEEEPLLESRIQSEERNRARNRAVAYVYEHQLDSVCILYADFTGLRRVPEPKEDVVGLYYNACRQAGQRRGGVRLYGGSGGDDAFVWIFPTADHAILCAAEIKRAFAADLFLRAFDVKFGLSAAQLGDEKEELVIRCWGNAKDCCEFKSTTFRNRGHFLVSQGTTDTLARWGIPAARFVRVQDETLGDADKTPLFKIPEIEPLL